MVVGHCLLDIGSGCCEIESCCCLMGSCHLEVESHFEGREGLEAEIRRRQGESCHY